MVTRIPRWVLGLAILPLASILVFTAYRYFPGEWVSGGRPAAARLMAGPSSGMQVQGLAPSGPVAGETGVVEGYTPNPHLDINAVRVRTGRSGELTIDFRPYTARAVMAVAAPGDPVEIDYNSNPDDEARGYRLRKMRNLRNGKEVVLDKLPLPPDIPPNRRAEYFTIRHPRLILDRYGGIVAIRSGAMLFHVKPGLVDDILPLIKNAAGLGLSAVWRDDHSGFVNVNHDKVYIVLSVTLDNKTFLVR